MCLCMSGYLRSFSQYIHLVLHQILEPDQLLHDDVHDRQKRIVAVFAPKIHVHECLRDSLQEETVKLLSVQETALAICFSRPSGYDHGYIVLISLVDNILVSDRT